MPVDPAAAIEVTAFAWVPPFARGQVRDLRVRWALEEAGFAYRTRLLKGERPTEYYREQPWGQVPAYREGDVQLFECGAICLHIAEQTETLLPRNPAERGRAIAWLFAALNSMDVPTMGLTIVGVFNADKPWSPGAQAAFTAFLEGRLQRLADWLGDKDWLEGQFTVGDLMMVCVLRSIIDEDLIARFPTIAAYIARGEARPAFQRAMAAHLADFVTEPA